MANENRRTKVFLCHAGEDKHFVQEIYKKLRADGFDPWLDKEDLLPGQLWKDEIPRVIHSAACMLVFLSNKSVAKRGYVQKEFKLALETLEEIPEGQIFLIPVRINECKIPDQFSRLHCCDLFEEDGYKQIVKAIRTTVTNELSDGPIEKAIRPWNLPLDRNPFFTDREEIISQLSNELNAKRKVALSGIPGVGKTQIALEYAYRDGKNYRAVLWSRAETKETLISSFIAIAGLLNIPEKDDQEEDRVIQAVKKWLSTHDRWLMVFDNVDDITFVRDFIPIAIEGHILLTTRTQAMGGMAHRIFVEPMTPTDGARYLVHRAGIISPNAPLDAALEFAPREYAERLSIELGGLPLAIDQAGAFIEENIMSPEEYLSLYKEEGKQLRQERGQHDAASQGHSESVTITFSLAFRRLVVINPAAAELLRLCSFLYPEQIPEKVLLESAEDLGEALSSAATNSMDWIKARQAACRLSLLSREIDSKSLNIHRVVQAVLKDEMNIDIQKKWAERAVRVINRGFPDAKFENWPHCERLILQALTCAELIVDFELAFPEAGRLLIALADYTNYRGRYEEAESFYNYAIEVRKKIYGPNHPEVGTCLTNLAVLYFRQGRYEESATLFKKDIDIQEQAFGAGHPNVGIIINNLAEICRIQGKYKKAESLYRRALEIFEKTQGTTHPNFANTLNNLGLVCWHRAKYDDAELLCKRALAISKKAYGLNHPAVASSLNNLSLVYWHRAKYDKAELLCKRALAIRKEAYGLKHASIADSLTNLASIYRDQEMYNKAESLFMRALDIRELNLGLVHPDVANSLKNIGLLYASQDRYQEAERLFRRALDILEGASVLNSQDAVTIFRAYTQLPIKTGQIEKAQELNERSKQK